MASCVLNARIKPMASGCVAGAIAEANSRRWVAKGKPIQNAVAFNAIGLTPTQNPIESARRKLAIFVSGCFWHRHTCGRCRIPAANRAYWIAKIDRNAARDRRVQRALRRLGYRVLVVWECQTTAARRERLRARVQQFLRQTGFVWAKTTDSSGS
jgi:hypothetical protein